MAGCTGLYTWYDCVTVLTFVVTLLITYLSQTGIFGESNSEISDQRPTPITPEGWTFSIWGLIFVGQAAALIYLLIRRSTSDTQQEDALQEFKRNAVKALWLWLCVGWAGEAAWTIVFARNTRTSVSVCAGLLITSCAAFLGALHTALPLRPGAFEYVKDTFMRHVLVSCIAINAAWLSVATALGILVAAAANNPGADLQPASIALAVIVAVVGAAIALSGTSISYSGALAFAFAGIASKDGASDTVVIAAWVCFVAMIATSIGAAVLRGLRSPRDAAAKDPALMDATEMQEAA